MSVKSKTRSADIECLLVYEIFQNEKILHIFNGLILETEGLLQKVSEIFWEKMPLSLVFKFSINMFSSSCFVQHNLDTQRL